MSQAPADSALWRQVSAAFQNILAAEPTKQVRHPFAQAQECPGNICADPGSKPVHMQVEMLSALHKAMAQSQPGLLQVCFQEHTPRLLRDLCSHVPGS